MLEDSEELSQVDNKDSPNFDKSTFRSWRDVRSFDSSNQSTPIKPLRAGRPTNASRLCLPDPKQPKITDFAGSRKEKRKALDDSDTQKRMNDSKQARIMEEAVDTD